LIASYLVCATQRSGSTLLCELLKGTGVAGCPEEFFEAVHATGRPPTPRDYGIDLDAKPGPVPSYSSLEGIDDYARHIERTLELGTTPNGVFGAKVMFSQLADIAELAAPLTFPDFLGEEPRYVRVTRTDRASQAVSLWTALQTQAWAAAHERPEDVAHYDFESIDKLAAWFDEQERGWDRYLEKRDPLELTYDEIAGDLKDAVRRVLVHLDLDPTPADSVEPPMERQADERSQEWVDRYRREVIA
jgi:LPS sulfotransferase NodH